MLPTWIPLPKSYRHEQWKEWKRMLFPAQIAHMENFIDSSASLNMLARSTY
jgi:hypothetical protein